MNNKFPRGFLWGAATSSYQIEGNNTNSDWWEWEQKGKTKEKSGIACDYWNRWKSDHELLTELGVNSFRLSLEWSRIEPEEGKFSEVAIEHYREILQDLKKRNIKTVVTFWHWTSPLWFSQKYGWYKSRSVNIFINYVKEVSQRLGDLIDVYVILNEPMVPLGMGYLTGNFPPGYKNPWKFWRALNNLAKAYKKAYHLIHELKPDSMVGISYLYNWYELESKSKIIEKIADKISWRFRIGYLARKIKNYQDYFGVDYYRLGKIKYDSKNSTYLGFRIAEDENNIMKWVAYPEGIYKVLKEAWEKYKLPIYILENGMPDDIGLDDPQRISFIEKHLEQVLKAIQEGVDVRGYNYWSLLDNYEWGTFHFRFGLVEIDYKTLERKPRKSFYAYRDIIKNNGL
jgi:beta-glucosidase